ncbi:hypothetical protein FRB94_002238 [Tulasnella sp. JGI-2019a]|nr:hypothetical protein FRB94_002238 [Tulasnella sp. JGI-2019a]
MPAIRTGSGSASPVTPKTPQRSRVYRTPTTPSSPTKALRTPPKVVAPQRVEWADIPVWTDNRSPFQELPIEILDQILSKNSGLALQDHLALSGTCRAIRKAYTESVWRSIHYWFDDSSVAVNLRDNIISNSNKVHVGFRAAAKSAQSEYYTTESIKDEVVEAVNSKTIVLTDAKRAWKLNDAQMANLRYEALPNPHHAHGADMRKYKLAAVRALAFRAHGGPMGHAAHVAKLEERTARAQRTREENGTSPTRRTMVIPFSSPIF